MRELNCYPKLELVRSTGLQLSTGGAAPRSATDARPLGMIAFECRNRRLCVRPSPLSCTRLRRATMPYARFCHLLCCMRRTAPRHQPRHSSSARTALLRSVLGGSRSTIAACSSPAMAPSRRSMAASSRSSAMIWSSSRRLFMAQSSVLGSSS